MAQAAAAFAEARALCSADEGRLWGHTLCVPMMFVDPATREAVLNQPAAGAVRDGTVYRLALPSDIGIANTSFELQGEHWSMVIWPLPASGTLRDILLMHESYHSIQPALGLVGNGVTVPLEKTPAGTQLTGDDWSLTLNNGYGVQPDPHRKGSFVVTRDGKPGRDPV